MVIVVVLEAVEAGRETRSWWCNARPNRACDDNDNDDDDGTGTGNGSGASGGFTFNETERACREGANCDVLLFGSGNRERAMNDAEEPCLVMGMLLSISRVDNGSGGDGDCFALVYISVCSVGNCDCWGTVNFIRGLCGGRGKSVAGRASGARLLILTLLILLSLLLLLLLLFRFVTAEIGIRFG